MPLASWISNLLDLCYPGVCPCGQLAAGAVGADSPSDLQAARRLCPSCLFELQLCELGAACERCAAPLPEHGAPCPRCEGRGRAMLGRVACLGVFDEPLRSLIHQFKYSRDWPLGDMLAARLAAHPSVAAVLEDADVLVPVPLYPLRQIARGFNQADVIARRVGRIAGRRVAPALRRIRNTPTQTHQTSRAARVANVRAAFALADASRVRGARVVLVDDVMTTAATLRSAAKVLRAAKPKSIDAIVFAVADPMRRNFERI